MVISAKQLAYMGLCIYTVGMLFSDTGMVFYILVAAFFVMQIPFFFSRPVFLANYFSIGYLLFIAYLLLMAFIGKALYPRLAINRCVILFINYLINILILNLLIDPEYRNRYFNYYPKAALACEFYLVAFSGRNLLKGRLGNMANTPLPYKGNANTVGLTLMIGVMLDTYLYLKDKKKHRLLRILLFLIGIMLTGSRKAIIAAALVLFAIPAADLFFNNRAKALKLFKHIIFAGSVSVLGIIALIKIPALYNIAGARLMALVQGVNTAGKYAESSLNSRSIMYEYAKMVFLQHPLFGIGIDNFAEVNYYRGSYAHSDYWEILTGGGLIGGIIYYSLYVFLVIKLLKNIRLVDATLFLVFIGILILLNTNVVSYLGRYFTLFLFASNSVFVRKSTYGLQSRRL